MRSVGANEPAERRLSVLLADDNADTRALLARALDAAGCAVIQVANGSEMMERLRTMRREKTQLDIIVSDVRMPGMSGFRAIEEGRQEGWRVPVVVVTAFDDDWVREEAARLEVDAIVDKPFDVAAVCALVTRLARGALGLTHQ